VGVTEYEQSPPADDDAPTQQIRRPAPPAPLPGPLDLTGSSRGPDRTPADTTEVLSLDELMDGAASPPVAAPAPPLPPPAAPPAPPLPPLVAAPAPAPAARRGPPPARDRLRADATAALAGAGRRTEDWLRTGDHALIVATAVIAMLLLVAVGSF
jgi:hypothetical protein